MNKLKASDLILPFFAVEGKNRREKIHSMPGVFRYSVGNLVREARRVSRLGVDKLLLFGLPADKDNRASSAYDPDGIVQKAVRALKREVKGLTIITDVCLCAYTSHGHCRILKPARSVDKQATLGALAKIAVSHAAAGADIVAPSAVMEGEVKAIRQALDRQGYKKVGVLAYSAKFASGFYGPFREALDSAPLFGDRHGYQLPFGDAEGALKRIARQIREGAAMVMVKPALAYLDIIYRAKKEFKFPLAAYSVSGEYSALKKLAGGDRAKEKELVLESLTAMKRAGADEIITYHAADVAEWL